MIGTGTNGVKSVRRQRLCRPSERRLARYLLEIPHNPETVLRQASVLNSGD
jgi:hypothetical protein